MVLLRLLPAYFGKLTTPAPTEALQSLPAASPGDDAASSARIEGATSGEENIDLRSDKTISPACTKQRDEMATALAA